MMGLRAAIASTLNFPTNQNGDMLIIQSKIVQRSHKKDEVVGLNHTSILLMLTLIFSHRFSMS